ncbi:hypothetical protein AB0D86_49745 [Streptomyces sp. NPDC048324]|uniref:hypothetical protein n=1 Tax=Streptomyces sp. NPDC048324 TaxID=3157205 RepID=UPI00343BEF25
MAAFGVAPAMDGVVAACLSAAPASADSASSTAEWTGSSEKARLRTLRQQSVAEGGRHAVFTGGDKSGEDDYLKHAFAKKFPLGLGQFMSDRAAPDRYNARLSLHIGDVHGADSSDPTSSASTRSTCRAPKAAPLLDTGCLPRPGSRRTARREAISPTTTLHPRKHA